MKNNLLFADIHCHPNLKTYGHSYDSCEPNKKCNVWYYNPPGTFTKLLNIVAGITRFSQADFTTLRKGGAGIVFASLYPFEKGFFINGAGKGSISAFLSNLITDIGYQRIRHLQKHTNYFEDLEKEYAFFTQSQQEHTFGEKQHTWQLASDWATTEKIIEEKNKTAVLLSIEGAHVFNSGLEEYGITANAEEIVQNIKTVKQWKYPPVFITFAHNFNNELCGHASSLEPIKAFVDQQNGLNQGFTSLGKKVLDHLLSDQNGKPVYIDIKHMSIKSRKEYFNLLKSDYQKREIPTLVSHGALNGMNFKGDKTARFPKTYYSSDINFFDEEVLDIARSGGLFAIQFDTRRIAQKKLVKKKLRSLNKTTDVERSAQLIWHQIQHMAELLDRNELPAWNIAAIGSDYDGTIDPLPGIWTAEYYPLLQKPLLQIAGNYLKNNRVLVLPENRKITPEEIVQRFFIGNTIRFLKQFR
ncbi:membrane dipeptidase [Maribellus mangrovi]|uniref:membrane dipeptidase n=1 Tax=Maribellus mangrovi TaxID=3133146 RepID=UPI0030EBB575